LDPHKRTVRVRPNDNLPEFLRCLQSSLGAHGISEFLSTWNWFAADLAGGIHRVLLLHCGDDVRHSDSELRQLVRLDPQAHGVLPGAENLHIPNSRHACQWVKEIDVAVIGNARMHTPPMSVIRIAITIATMGRRTKNSDIC